MSSKVASPLKTNQVAPEAADLAVEDADDAAVRSINQSSSSPAAADIPRARSSNSLSQTSSSSPFFHQVDEQVVRVEKSAGYQFDSTFGMFACKEILPELIARFEALDEDGSGEVDVSELEELLEAAGEKVNPLELESVFQEFDADGSGFITVDEFLNTMHKRWLRQNEAEIDLAEAFAFLDKDHDGLVSVDEIADQMKSLMRVTISTDEIRSICKVSLSKNPKGLTMEDFKFLVHWKPALEEGAVVQDETLDESSGSSDTDDD